MNLNDKQHTVRVLDTNKKIGWPKNDRTRISCNYRENASDTKRIINCKNNRTITDDWCG